MKVIKKKPDTTSRIENICFLALLVIPVIVTVAVMTYALVYIPFVELTKSL